MQVDEVSTHLERDNGQAERQSDPEPAAHVPQLRAFLGRLGRNNRLQRHPANGAVARAHLAHLGMHGTGVLDVRTAAHLSRSPTVTTMSTCGTLTISTMMSMIVSVRSFLGSCDGRGMVGMWLH